VIVQADLESLKRMLGCDEQSLPKLLVREYSIRLRMFHADGNSGPLGSLGLIDLLRFLKHGPKPPPEPPRFVDWSRMPTNGSLQVEALSIDNKKLIQGNPTKEEWRSGVYLGRVGVGGLAVRLDGDTWVHEFSQRDVRLPATKLTEEEESHDMPLVIPIVPLPTPMIKPPAIPPAIPPTPPKIPDFLKSSEEEIEKFEEELKESEKPALQNPPKADPLDSASVGDPVWVREGGDYRDGTFQGRGAGGVLVQIVGEVGPRILSADRVVYAETAEAKTG